MHWRRVKAVHFDEYFYRPQTKFGGGNVFIDIYLSVSPPDNRHGNRPSLPLPPLPWTSDLGTYPPLRNQTWGSPPLLVTSGGHHWRPVQTCSFGDNPPPLRATSGSGNWNWSMYGFQAGSMHPPGMLSCSSLFINRYRPLCKNRSDMVERGCGNIRMFMLLHYHRHQVYPLLPTFYISIKSWNGFY